MITEIIVDGFKSLNNFRLLIKKGLNILVGPNGAGKTNIISFFEFLSYLNQYEIHEAVSHIGGAGSIFTKIGDTEFKDSIKGEIFGYCPYATKKYLRYYYSFLITVSTKEGQIYFEDQELKLQVLDIKESVSFDTLTNIEWDLDLKCNIAASSNKLSLEFKSLNRRRIKNRFRDKFTKEELESNISSFYQRNGGRSILQILARELDPIRPIIMDLVGGEVFNIIPSKVKIPEDIAKQPGINTDGTGLASTLYAIKNKRYFNHNRLSFYSFRRVRSNPKTYDRIISLTKLANDSIEDIDVSNNAFDNQLVVKIKVSSEGSEKTVLPLSAMSDGTIKWITLITAILSSSQIFSIEEPENFLHPWMQSEIMKIMRTSFETKSEDSFSLMSSHSETLLNNADPEEVIVVSMKKGNTIGKRVSNSALLREEISATGFGLGYYYLSGGLENE